MKTLLPILLLALAAMSAHARLGETTAQLYARMGNSGSSSGIPVPWCTNAIWLQHGYRFDVTFVNGISVSETYQMLTPANIPNAYNNSATPIPPDQVKTLLDINSQGHHWTASSNQGAPSVSSWSRDDGATALLSLSNFHFELPAYSQAKAAYEKTLEPSVKGF